MILVSFWPQMQSLYLMSYGLSNAPALDFLFMALGCAATSGAGLAFAALQMRFGTRRVVLACAALVLVGLTILTNVEGAAWAFPEPVLLLGFGEGASLANPFLLFAVVTALGVLVAWAAVRRIEVR